MNWTGIGKGPEFVTHSKTLNPRPRDPNLEHAPCYHARVTGDLSAGDAILRLLPEGGGPHPGNAV